jgi:hypothetical protein
MGLGIALSATAIAKADLIPWGQNMGGNSFRDASFIGGRTVWTGNSLLMDFSGDFPPTSTAHRAITQLNNCDFMSISPDITGLTFEIDDQNTAHGYILSVYIVASLASNSILGYWDFIISNYHGGQTVLVTTDYQQDLTTFYGFPGRLTPVSLDFYYLQQAEFWYISLAAYSYPNQDIDGSLFLSNLNWTTNDSPRNVPLNELRPIPEGSTLWSVVTGLTAIALWRTRGGKSRAG